MSKMEYMPVDCLQVPKMLFQVEEFKNLSNTAKILYSLFLDRLKFAVQNGWVDHNGDLFVIYPKSEMKKDLNTTRYGVDQAVQELVKIGKLVRIVQNDGKANHFYINDIYENEMEEESMMTLDRIMANMQMEEREIIMDKMVAASRDILGTIADMGYLNEYETPLTPMEERGYYDEKGNLDIDAVEADGYEFGMPKLDDIVAMLTAARSRNIRFHIVIQSYSQMIDKYSENISKTVMDNCGNLIYLHTREISFLEYISKLAGKNEFGRPLLSVSRLQHLKKNETVIFHDRCYPMVVQDLPLVFEYSMELDVL